MNPALFPKLHSLKTNEYDRMIQLRVNSMIKLKSNIQADSLLHLLKDMESLVYETLKTEKENRVNGSTPSAPNQRK
jgi:hypothetical protein